MHIAIKFIEAKEKEAAFKDINMFECFEAELPHKRGDYRICMKIPIHGYRECYKNACGQLCFENVFINAVTLCFKSAGQYKSEITTKDYSFRYGNYIGFEDDVLVKPVESKFEIIRFVNNNGFTHICGHCIIPKW